MITAFSPARPNRRGFGAASDRSRRHDRDGAGRSLSVRSVLVAGMTMPSLRQANHNPLITLRDQILRNRRVVNRPLFSQHFAQGRSAQAIGLPTGPMGIPSRRQ